MESPSRSCSWQVASSIRYYDNGVRLGTIEDFEFLEWSAVASVPEPAIFLDAFHCAVVAGVWRWAQVSLRKFYVR